MSKNYDYNDIQIWRDTVDSSCNELLKTYYLHFSIQSYPRDPGYNDALTADLFNQWGSPRDRETNKTFLNVLKYTKCKVVVLLDMI